MSQKFWRFSTDPHNDISSISNIQIFFTIRKQLFHFYNIRSRSVPRSNILIPQIETNLLKIFFHWLWFIWTINSLEQQNQTSLSLNSRLRLWWQILVLGSTWRLMKRYSTVMIKFAPKNVFMVGFLSYLWTEYALYWQKSLWRWSQSKTFWWRVLRRICCKRPWPKLISCHNNFNIYLLMSVTSRFMFLEIEVQNIWWGKINILTS